MRISASIVSFSGANRVLVCLNRDILEMKENRNKVDLNRNRNV